MNGQPNHRHRRAAQDLRLRRGVFSRREGRCHHAPQPLRPAARLGKHHHLHRPPQARRLARPGARTTAGHAAPHMCWNNNSQIADSCGQYAAQSPSRSRTTSAASCAARWSCSGPRSAASCSSPASIFPICCWPAPPPAPRSSPCAVRSAQAARASCASCSPKASSSPAREPSAVSALAAVLVAWLAPSGSHRTSAAEHTAHRRRRSRLDGAHRRLRRRLLRPRPRTPHGFGQPAGVAQRLRHRAPARAASTSACAPFLW